jgi:hypothetical protein
MKAVRLTRALWLSDRVNGDAGTPLALEDDEARELVETWHNAVYDPALQRQLDNAPQEIPVVKREDAPTPDQLLDLADQGLAPERAVQQLTEELGLYDEPGDADDGEPLTMPWTTHSKAKWIEWALHGNHGQSAPDLATVAGMTKNELMGTYGERL